MRGEKALFCFFLILGCFCFAPLFFVVIGLGFGIWSAYTQGAESDWMDGRTDGRTDGWMCFYERCMARPRDQIGFWVFIFGHAWPLTDAAFTTYVRPRRGTYGYLDPGNGGAERAEDAHTDTHGMHGLDSHWLGCLGIRVRICMGCIGDPSSSE